MTLPQVVLQGREGPMRNIAEGTDLEQNPFYAPFKKFPAAIGADEAATLRRDGEGDSRKGDPRLRETAEVLRR